jgi:quinol monooxygenase YgiN
METTMSARVYFHLNFKIHDGKIGAFRKLADEMTALTKSEPGSLGYEWFLNADGSGCRLLETYADQAAVTTHINGKGVALLPRLLEVSSITSFDVYGDPGPTAASSLSSLGAELFGQIAGIVR